MPLEVLATTCFSRVLALSCCSTPVICTSCWVNWLESSGEVGSWFFSCVVSSVRKVLKLSARLAMPWLVASAAEAGVAVAGAVTVILASDPDVDARERGAAKLQLRGWTGVRRGVERGLEGAAAELGPDVGLRLVLGLAALAAVGGDVEGHATGEVEARLLHGLLQLRGAGLQLGGGLRGVERH